MSGGDGDDETLELQEQTHEKHQQIQQKVEEESKVESYDHLKMDAFNEATFMAKSTAFFSTQQPYQIFARLIDAIEQMDDSKVTRDAKKWKMTFEVIKKQSEAETQNKIPSEGCKVTCKLLRVDESKVCVEFSRTMGSSWFFFDTVRQLQDSLVMNASEAQN